MPNAHWTEPRLDFLDLSMPLWKLRGNLKKETLELIGNGMLVSSRE